MAGARDEAGRIGGVILSPSSRVLSLVCDEQSDEAIHRLAVLEPTMDYRVGLRPPRNDEINEVPSIARTCLLALHRARCQAGDHIFAEGVINRRWRQGINQTRRHQ